MKLSIVIPVWNGREFLKSCLASVRRELGALEYEAEVIVVDDASTDGAQFLVESEFDDFQLLKNEANRGFAVSANRGMGAARGEVLLLLGSDTELEPGTLAKLLGLLEQEGRRCVIAPRLLDSAGETQRSCMAWPRLATLLFFGTPLERWLPNSKELRRYFLRDFDHESPRADVQPPATCWLMRRDLWQEMGGFDESLCLFFNDVDWARRLVSAGGGLHYRPEVCVRHLGGASTGARPDFIERWQTDRLHYYRKRHGWLAGLLVKACVTWTFCDWWVQQWLATDGRDSPERRGSLRRAFAHFLMAE